MKSFNLALVLLGSQLLLTSCASKNYHAEYYVKNIDVSQVPLPEINQMGTDPLIVSSQNLNQDYNTLLSKGYIFLGYSSFEAEMDQQYNVIQQGRDVGANIILTSNQFLGISSSTIPLLLPTSSTTYQSGSLSGSGNTRYSNSYGSYLGQSNSHFNGSYSGSSTTQSNQWVPMTVSSSVYKQTTAFFVKTNQQFKFGAYYRELNPNERKQIGRNAGVIVTTVIENTPAFFKDILVGDVIVSINDTEVSNIEQIASIINSDLGVQKIQIVRSKNTLAINFTNSEEQDRKISSQSKK